MRLTLRTMLAYLDDILEPADAEDIGQKIEESEFATDLVNRMRDVTRRLRLGTPKLYGRGMGGDPNSVAEYLDNTLPGERVPEFERVCLESDVQLAEVASCHQILTLVLGAPAQVEPASRNRMYRIAGKDHEVAIDGPEPLLAAVVDEPEVVRGPRAKPEIPEYLREERSWSRMLVPLAAAVVLIGGLVWVVLQAVGPLQLAQIDDAPPVDGAAIAPDPDATPAPAGAAAPDVVIVDEPVEGDVVQPADEGPLLDEEGDDLAVTPMPVPAPDTLVPSEDPATPPVEPPGETDETMDLAAPPTPNVVDLPDDAPATPPAPVSAEEVEVEGVVATEEGESPRVATRPAEVEPLVDGNAAPADSLGVGRLLANTDVMLRYEPTADARWEQLVGGALLSAGDRLLAMPGFGATFALSHGVTVRALSGTELELPESSGEIPAVNLLYGRAVLMTAGRPDAQLHLRTAQQASELIFRDAETTIAIEVSSRWATGLSPETDPLPPIVDLYVTRGRLAWKPAGSDEEFVLEAPAYQRWDGSEALAVDPIEVIPAWTTGMEELSQIDQRAVGAMKVHLQPDRPIELTLRELASNRRPEVVSLAVRCLAYAGNYAPLIDTLNDQSQRGSWDDHIRVLTHLGARDDRSAAEVRMAFETRRPEGAADLDRMLWGYTDEQLRGGAARQLVDFLDHDHLDYRVLAFWNLSRITGFTLYYRPEYPAPRREQYVQKWRQKLDAGLVVPKAEEL